MPGKRKYSSSGSSAKKSKTSSGRAKVKVRYSKSSRSAANMSTAGLVGVETKYFDTNASGPWNIPAPTSCAGGVVTLSNDYNMASPMQGNSASAREGNRIDIKSVQVQGHVQIAKQTTQTAADNATIVSVFLVQDTQTNAAQCTSELVFTNPSGSSILAHAPFRNLIYTKRFKVLAKKMITITAPELSWNGTTIEQNGIMRPFNLFKKVKMPVHFVGGAGDSKVGSIMDNSLHVVAFCNNLDLAPTLAFNSRIRFTG